MRRAERGATPAGFRDRLLARLRNRAREQNVAAQRLQQRVAFERFLVRLTASGDWVLKGGFALELRYGWGNRPTRDLDLRTLRDPEHALAELRGALTSAQPADHFSFELADTRRELHGAPDGATRVLIISRLAGLVFAEFHVDVSSGDALEGEPDLLEGSDLLSFTGIGPIRFPAYPVAQQLAEKLHAYTLPRSDENTRVKDLVDLVTIAALESVDGNALVVSLRATFARRVTHALPDRLPEPPAAWIAPFRSLTHAAPVTPTTDLHEGYLLAAAFWDPVLAGAVSGRRWIRGERTWRAPAG